LSNSESSLLEKESKLAYVETLNAQLQARLQKMMDRESSTESYLQDLESKLNSHTSGDEKNATIIRELQKEIARVRENEASCEEYVSTLEERLAESEQDMELMRREIARLEHVIDRQRSLGKLDHLLLELDSIKDKENGSTNGLKVEEANTPRPASLTGSEKSDCAQDKSLLHVRGPTPPSISGTPPILESPAEEEYEPGKEDEYKYMPQSPAQSQFVADKFETVQQELFELKVEHEQTLTEFNQVSVNYEAALRKMSKLQDQMDELRHAKSVSTDTTSVATSPPESPIQRPDSFLAGSRVSDLKGLEESSSSSRLLSSELSLAGESPTLTPAGESRSLTPAAEIVSDREEALKIDDRENALKIHLETETERTIKRASQSTPDDLLKKFEILVKEKEEAERIANEETQRLHQQLAATRDELVTLKNISNAVGASNPKRNSGRNSPPTQFLRRKSSQSLAVVDRAQRAFANLRRMATENLASQPEVLEAFELNIDSAMRELTNRLDRIGELEVEVNSLRKEMEAKTTMIVGLTRERTSIQTSPMMDISVVSVMQRRIDETETQLHKTKQSLADRERELLAARGALENLASDSPSNALSLLDELSRERRLTSDQASKILALHDQVEHMRSDQLEALSSLQDSKRTLERTISELEEDLTLARETAMQTEKDLRHSYDRQVHDYQDRVEALQKTILANRETVESQLARVGELEKAQEDAQREIETLLNNHAASSSSSEDQVRKHQEEVKRHQAITEELEQKIAQSKELIESQQARLDAMERDYDEAVKQLEVLKEEKAAALTALKEAEERALADATAAAAAHEELLAAVRAELAESQATAAAHADNLAKLQEAYDKLSSEKPSSSGESRDESTEELEQQLAEHKQTIETQVAALKELQETQDQREEELRKLREKERKHAKLVENLEQELTFTFDQNQESTQKLAAVEALLATSEQKTAESQKVMESLNEEIVKLRVSPLKSGGGGGGC
jgi:chromosome segregation ATPase